MIPVCIPPPFSETIASPPFPTANLMFEGLEKLLTLLLLLFYYLFEVGIVVPLLEEVVVDTNFRGGLE